MMTRQTSQDPVAQPPRLNMTNVAGDPTRHHEHDAPTTTKVQDSHDYQTGHVSTFKLACATLDHGIQQLSARSCENCTYDGGTQKNPKCVSCSTQQG